MSEILIQGWGAVSPAGWTSEALRRVREPGAPLPFRDVSCPGYAQPIRAHAVPVSDPRPTFTGHARLRRTSPIAQYAVAAAREALGQDSDSVALGALRLGIVYCAMSGCVNFSRRFYDETLKDPATASPVVFPETVFNAPSSHLGAMLGSTGINYTLVGDPGTFLQGLALAADWLSSGRVDGCLVVGAEELDWLIVQAFNLFEPAGIVSEGAGALYLRRGIPQAGTVELQAVTESHLFWNTPGRATAARLARAELGNEAPDSLLCDGLQGLPRLDHAEATAWKTWTGARCSPKQVVGEAFVAAAAWQCVLAADSLSRQIYRNACVSVVGCNQQAIAARFGRS